MCVVQWQVDVVVGGGVEWVGVDEGEGVVGVDGVVDEGFGLVGLLYVC